MFLVCLSHTKYVVEEGTMNGLNVNLKEKVPVRTDQKKNN